MDIEQTLQAVKEVYVNYPKQQNEEALKKVEKEIVDIEHLIEIRNFNASEGYKYAKELKRARVERRRIKDEMALLGPIKDLLMYAKPRDKNITKTINDVQGILASHKVRTYKMRVRDDLQELVK